jgi:hypothetical protein
MSVRPTILLFLALLTFLFLRAGPAAAQQQAPVTVFALLDRTHGTVGDPINLTVAVRYAAGVTVDTDNLEEQFAPFETLTETPPNDLRNLDGSGERRLRFTITAYQTGPAQLPALSIPYTLNGTPGQAQGQPLSYAVESVIQAGDKAGDIRPLKPQLALPFAATGLLRWWIAGAGAVAVAVAAILTGAALVLARRRKPAPADLETLDLESQPEDVARRELDALAADALLEQGHYREHYARMAELIRRYITQRYGFPASALTTTELGLRMERSGVGRWRARLVAGLLAECDAVHFAHYVPAPARAEADLQMAYEIVDLTLSQQSRPEDVPLEAGRS